MKYLPAESTRHLIGRIRTLAPIIGIVFVFGATPLFARGGGHGGGHSGGHSGHPGGHYGHHHGSHVGESFGGITGGSTARGHFTNQNPCAPADKISENCPQLGEKQLQTIPAEKAGNRFESRFE